MSIPLPDYKPRLVVIGNGMAGARFVEDVLAFDRDRFAVTVFGDEPHGNYNRILLPEVLNGTHDAKDIMLNPLAWYDENGVALRAGERVASIDRAAKVVHTAAGREQPYDILVLATGARPVVPPMTGTHTPGVFAFRNLDDCAKIHQYSQGRTRVAVIGGGLLGLEAARALHDIGLRVTVVHRSGTLLSAQLDAQGGAALRHAIEGMGIAVVTDAQTTDILGETEVTGLRFADGHVLATDMVVLSAGIRPNAGLAEGCGLEVGKGIVVDDQLRTSDPSVFAVGECVEHRGVTYGLVAPVWEQTKVLARVLTGADPEHAYLGSKSATKLKVMGVEVVSAGRVTDVRDGDEVVTYTEPARGVYKKVIVRANKVVAACVVGDADGFDEMSRLFNGGGDAPERRADLLFPRPASGAAEMSLADLPDGYQVCDCNGVSKATICDAIRAGKCTVPGVGKATRAGNGCGSCKKTIEGLIKAVAGAVKADPAEAWYVPAVALDKPALVAAIRERNLRSVSAVLAELGHADDEKSKMGLSSLLKSMWHGDFVDERDSRYVNDRVHANIQKDGTFSVIPRMYGGVTTADDLIRLGEVAKKYNVPMVKVTGGQRIDLLGIKKEDLPGVWRDLDMDCGFAYAKAFRTCKTCVGIDYCRFGTNDSTALGIAIEKRFQGFEFPAKMKMAVSGCPRNCAESTVKDVGVVATEGGDWEILVGGAAGAHVRKTDVLCRVKSKDECIKIVGRFLQYYRENAKWLERTYDFVPRIGLETVKQIVVEDSLGIGERLDAEIEATATNWIDPWRAEAEKPAYSGQFEAPRSIALPMLS